MWTLKGEEYDREGGVKTKVLEKWCQEIQKFPKSYFMRVIEVIKTEKGEHEEKAIQSIK